MKVKNKIPSNDYVNIHKLLKNRIDKLQKRIKENHKTKTELEEKLSHARSQLYKLVLSMIQDPESFNASIDEILKTYES